MSVVRKYAPGTNQPVPGQDVTSASITDIRALYPQRPTYKESQANDSTFEVTFKIELVTPDLARLAQNPPTPSAAP
ncbi:MAG: hypothetical protein HC898_10925, partial [Phycisphaerales bacterium]|nr:hypothetical protein [Phycisphaerales bacterium]